MAEIGFVALDPRKAKRARMIATLGDLGPIHWLRMPPLRWRNYPETAARVQLALEAAQSVTAPWLIGVKRKMLALQYNGTRAYFEKHPAAVAVCWNGLNGARRAFMEGAKDAGARRLYFELSPLAGRVTVDPNGVNYLNSLPRNLGPYLNWFAASGLPADGWREIGAQIKQRKAASEKPAFVGDLPGLDMPFLFVPLQYPGDSQMRLFGGAFRTVESFVQALGQAAKALPEGWHLRIKDHPTAPVSFAQAVRDLGQANVVMDNATDTFAQVAASRGVVTVNSSVGLEAMFYEKPVIAAGQCFWAIAGLAEMAPSADALAQVFARAGGLGFDPAGRAAFLSFLTEIYYPAPGPDQAAKVAIRLQGGDEFGFWRQDGIDAAVR